MSHNQSDNSEGQLTSQLTPAQLSLHNNFVTSVRSLRRDLVRSAYYLLQIRERHIYRAMGFAKITDYAVSTAGLNPRQCRDFLTLAKRLPRFPEVELALKAGQLSWSQAKMICSRTDPCEQAMWVDAARGGSVRALADQLPPHSNGGKESPTQKLHPPKKGPEPLVFPSNVKPKSPPRNSASIPVEKTHHVTLKFCGEQYSRWEKLAEAARRRGSLGEAVLNGLAGEGAGGMGPAHIVILECPTCLKAVIPTTRGEIAVTPPHLEARRCDAVIEDAGGNRRRTIKPKVRRQVMQRARYRCETKGCGNATFLQIHHRQPVSGAGLNSQDNLIVLCWRCHRKLHESDDGAREAIKKAP